MSKAAEAPPHPWVLHQAFGEADTQIDTVLNNIGEWSLSRNHDVFAVLNFFLLEAIELFF